MAEHQHPTDWLSSSKPASHGERRKQSWTRRHKTGLGLAFAGVVAGGVLASTLGASAATGTAPAAEGYGLGHSGTECAHGAPPAGKRGPRPGEKPLSASLTASLTATALAAVPGGTVNHVGAGRGDAAYDAHVTKADGTKVRVEFDKNQKVLRVEADNGAGHHGSGGPGGGPGVKPEGGPGGGPEGGGSPTGG